MKTRPTALSLAVALALTGCSISPERAREQAMACVDQNMTWTPRYNRFGKIIEVRCNPDKPFLPPPEE